MAVIRVKDMAGNVKNPDPSITGYYLRVRVQKKTGEDDEGNPIWENAGWTLINTSPINEGETEYELKEFVKLDKSPLSNVGPGDKIIINPGNIDQYRIDTSDPYAIRMITIQNPSSINNWNDAIADEQHASNIADDAPENYEWKGIEETGTGFIVNIQEAKKRIITSVWYSMAQIR